MKYFYFCWNNNIIFCN